MEELTKSGKLVSEKTFGTLVCRDTACRHAAVDLGLFDPDLRLVGRYLHYCGYRSLPEARAMLNRCVRENQSPFALIERKTGKIIDFNEWRRGAT